LPKVDQRLPCSWCAKADTCQARLAMVGETLTVTEPGFDFDALLATMPSLGAVAFNGATAARAEAAFAARGLATYRLPSTSPAHAALSHEAKLARWATLRTDGWITP
jgi:G:T/U-mismatch repair DNA glycosylase